MFGEDCAHRAACAVDRRQPGAVVSYAEDDRCAQAQRRCDLRPPACEDCRHQRLVAPEPACGQRVSRRQFAGCGCGDAVCAGVFDIRAGVHAVLGTVWLVGMAPVKSGNGRAAHTRGRDLARSRRVFAVCHLWCGQRFLFFRAYCTHNVRFNGGRNAGRSCAEGGGGLAGAVSADCGDLVARTLDDGWSGGSVRGAH